jgi:fructose-1,6-bisphosphatase/sedoheptulose 1,7-bisphosphatase-like protein
MSNADLLRGAGFVADGARTNSIVLSFRYDDLRFVDSIHRFPRARGHEIRL